MTLAPPSEPFGLHAEGLLPPGHGPLRVADPVVDFIADEGEAGLRGGPPGDLYIFISIKPHDLFQRDGADLYARVPIAMTTAALVTTPAVALIPWATASSVLMPPSNASRTSVSSARTLRTTSDQLSPDGGW